MNSRNVIVSMVTCLALLGGATLVSAAGKDKPKRGGQRTASAAVAKVGEKAPDFLLKDSAGVEHRLSDYTKQGKIVVLEWFNPECPFVKLHHEKQTTLVDMHNAYKGKHVMFFAIDSTNTTTATRDAEARRKWNLEYPVLVDADGHVGKMYGAKTTPHMFVIDKTGTLRYSGAMDNDPRNEKKGKDKENFVREALNALTSGKALAHAETKPYGCSVKYKD